MLSCMRTTFDLNDDLFRKLKRRAADDGVALREIVETALRLYLSGKAIDSGYRLKWTTDRGTLLPGVDLDSRESLFDIMEGRK